MAVATVMTGMVPYWELNVADPIAVAIEATGMYWLAAVTDFGALLGLGTVVLTSIVSMTEILLSKLRLPSDS